MCGVSLFLFVSGSGSGSSSNHTLRSLRILFSFSSTSLIHFRYMESAMKKGGTQAQEDDLDLPENASASEVAEATANANNLRKLPSPLECPEEYNHVHDLDTCRSFVTSMADSLRNRTSLLADIVGVTFMPDAPMYV